MICVKYEPGCLGNFLCQVLQGNDPAVALDYGTLNDEEILHTGAYNNVNDPEFKKDISLNKHKIISHNNEEFEDFLYADSKLKFVFISLDSHFIEYRLNYIHKIHAWHERSNRFDLEAWRDFDHPIAFADARRIFRLHSDQEQVKKQKLNDFVFPFANFYSEKNIWVDNLLRMADKLDLNLSEDRLKDWHDCFKIGQKDILARAEHLRVCIQQGKFTNDLNENEKGIIIGHQAVKESRDDADFFIEIYSKFSTR